ncbi:MAG: hypothetical protein ACXVHL_35890 [Solirubrobacteraceae bacterium]
MTDSVSKRRFQGYASAARTPRALHDGTPKLGRSFGKDLPDPPKSREDWSVKGRLVSNLGPRGYGHLLQQLETSAAASPKKKRRRKPRRKAVVPA